MEAFKLKTLEDLLASPEERVELIDGEIVRRPMARSEHGIVQNRASVELGPFDRKSGPGGWWIITEVSVGYERPRRAEAGQASFPSQETYSRSHRSRLPTAIRNQDTAASRAASSTSTETRRETPGSCMVTPIR